MRKKLPLIARMILGFVFFGAGLFGLIKGMQAPPDLPESMKTFIAGMSASGYFFPFLKSAETVCGLLLLTGMYVPLALVVLAPILLNIFLVNAFMIPSGLPLVIVLGALEIYLAFFAAPYRNVIRPLFSRRH
ncbi:MAG: DoxX family membrane protein [Bdellovibrionia bacterium]